MTVQEQAIQSGLVFCDGDTDEAPRWNVNDWPRLLGGWCYGHASVVLNHPEKDNAQTVVVLGGRKQNGITNSVLVLNLDEGNKQWQEAAPMNQSRQEHAAAVCNGGVYVIGGQNGSSYFDSIERVDVGDFLEASRTNMPSYQWTTLNCRMTTGRNGCSAAAIHDRYIVIVGGHNGGHYLSSVDIVDTALQNNHTVSTGPCMTIARVCCASTVVGQRIFVVGGFNGRISLTSVESLEFQQPLDNDTKKTDASSVPLVVCLDAEQRTRSFCPTSYSRSCHSWIVYPSCRE